MKYEVGDVVKIRDDLVLDEECGRFFMLEENIKNKGKVLEIQEVREKYYIIDGCWWWTDESIERKATTKECIDNGYGEIEYGDKVRVIEAEDGAWGANDCEGTLIENYNSETHGLGRSSLGTLLVELDDGKVWGIGNNATLEKVKGYSFRNMSCDVNINLEDEFASLTESYLEDLYKEILTTKNEIKGDDFMSMISMEELFKNSEPTTMWEGNKLKNITEAEFIVRLRKLDNGWTVEVDGGGEVLERIGDDVSELVGDAVESKLYEIDKMEEELRVNKLEVKGLEERLKELKGE